MMGAYYILPARSGGRGAIRRMGEGSSGLSVLHGPSTALRAVPLPKTSLGRIFT